MSTQQQFRQTALVIALSAVFPLSSAWAEDDDVAQLISPNVTEVTVNVPWVNEVNPLYRQYNGINNQGVNANLDLNIVRRSDDAEWFRLNARNLGLSTQEFGVSMEKQGDWALGLNYDQIPRYAPYAISTAVSGIGTNTITQPSYANSAFTSGSLTNPNLYDVTLKTERDIVTLNASKFVAKDVKLSFMFKNEEKSGLRMDGVRGVAGTNGSTGGTANRYSGFLFSPEPIGQTHKQFEATLDFTNEKYQITAGFYGSFLNTRDNSLNVIPGTNTQLVTTTAPLLSPIALAPDNSMQQFFVSGAYNFSPDTRANLKVSYSDARQNDGFFSGQPTMTGIGTSLNGEVRTTEVFSSVTSRINKNLKLLASWRYEDKVDKTPIRQYVPTSFGEPYNNPESHTANWGKLEADYRLGGGYSVTAGVDYTNKASLEWERNKVSETTTRLAVRKNMGETINGTVSVAHSDRTGSEWTTASAPPIYPVYLADRKRNKIRGMVDWAVTEALSLQAAYEGYFDDYSKSTYGLDSGKGQVFSLDGTYLISDAWKMNAWYSRQNGDSHQNMQGAVCSSLNNANCTANTPRTGPLIQWDANLKLNSDQVGFGLNGKVQKVDLGAQFLFARDANKQQINGIPATTPCSVTGCPAPVAAGMGVLPDTKYTQNTLRLNGTYPLDKATKVRLDYIYDLRKMDDYTWSNWVYADGTKVYVKPEQTTQIIGVSLSHQF